MGYVRLLVKRVDTTHKDPEKDKLCYKRGDIVKVYPSEKSFGAKIEQGGKCIDPQFCIIEVPSVEYTEAMNFYYKEVVVSSLRAVSSVIKDSGEVLDSEFIVKRRANTIKFEEFNSNESTKLDSNEPNADRIWSVNTKRFGELTKKEGV